MIYRLMISAFYTMIYQSSSSKIFPTNLQFFPCKQSKFLTKTIFLPNNNNMDQQFSGTLHLCSHKDHVQYALSKFTLAPMISAGGQATTKFRIDYGHKKYYDIHPEDVINVQRSSLLPPNLRILAFPMRNERRIQVDGYLILDEKKGQNGNAGIDIDALRNAILKWVATGKSKPPHHPFTDYERKILVILNPFSGQQKAEEMWRRDVEPLWHQAGLQIEVVITKHAGHAVELAQQIDLNRIGMIALGSGDGLFSEVLHGLLTNKTGAERERALRLPILHLPMGTGNALASSICFQSNEPFSPRGSFCPQMALMAISPVYRRLRLHRVEFSNGQRKTMFLSLSWGLMADIDIGSERFRFLGMARLHLEAFIRVARLPSVARYRAKISYLPVGNEKAKLMEKLRYRVNEERHNFGPSHFEDGEIIEEGENAKNDEQNVQMPPLNEPVPSTWKTIEGEFCFVTVAALSHLGSDLPYLPSARLHDPILFLTFVQWPKLNSRFHMARILLSIDTSDHLADPAFEIIPCLACRIEPESGAGGWLALDGEAMDWQQPPAMVNNKLDNKQDSTVPPPSFQVGVSNECATVVSRRERQRGPWKEDNENE